MMVADIRGIMIIRIICSSDIVGLFLNQDGQDGGYHPDHPFSS